MEGQVKVYCHSCGAEHEDNDRIAFCSICGAPLKRRSVYRRQPVNFGATFFWVTCAVFLLLVYLIGFSGRCPAYFALISRTIYLSAIDIANAADEYSARLLSGPLPPMYINKLSDALSAINNNTPPRCYWTAKARAADMMGAAIVYYHNRTSTSDTKDRDRLHKYYVMRSEFMEEFRIADSCFPICNLYEYFSTP